MKRKAMTARQILGSTAQQYGDSWRWEKQGGHPNAALHRIREKLAAAGFKVQPRPDSTWSADGENVRHGELWRHRDGRTAAFSSYYGPTKDYNSFSVTIAAAPEDRRVPIVRLRRG
jgi:hypothetical protein